MVRSPLINSIPKNRDYSQSKFDMDQLFLLLSVRNSVVTLQ